MLNLGSNPKHWDYFFGGQSQILGLPVGGQFQTFELPVGGQSQTLGLPSGG